MKTRPILRLLFLILTAITLLMVNAPTTHASVIYMRSSVVISQLYGGAEGINASYSSDYIELFNRGSEAVPLTGWSVQVAEEGSATWQVTPLNGTLQPGQYYLIQQGDDSEASNLPLPDVRGNTELNASGGKVALVQGTTPLTDACPIGIVADLVGYGDEECAESEPTGQMGEVEALLRRGAGCTESDNNAYDFESGVPTPHNRTAPSQNCRGPVVLVDYSTHNERGYIAIRWETSFEAETRGFNLYRGTDTTQNPIRINTAEIPAQGGSGQINRYHMEDYEVESNVTYYYILEDIDINNVPTLTSFPPILRENPSAVSLAGLTAIPKTNGSMVVIMSVGVLLAAAWVWRQAR